MNLISVDIKDLIKSPYQGRILPGDSSKSIYLQHRLHELAQSIELTGLMQPIVVRSRSGKYEIIDGHRRVEAHKILKREKIEAILVEGEDGEMQAMSLVANLQRASLSNFEKALAFERVLNAGVFKSKKELSKAIGKDETYIGDIMNILRMDKRIISDIALNNPTSDVRLLRIIRKAGDVNAAGISEAQYSLYQRFLNEDLTRAQLHDLAYEASGKYKKPYKVNFGSRGFSITLYKKLDKQQKLQFKSLLDKEVHNILARLKTSDADKDNDNTIHPLTDK